MVRFCLEREVVVERDHTMYLPDQLPETPTSRHRVKVKAPKSGSDRLELVLDDDRDDINTHGSKSYYNYNDDDECRQTNPQDNEYQYIVDDKYPQSLYQECTSSHSASTTETDNRASARSSTSEGSSLRRTWSIESGGGGDKYGGSDGGVAFGANDDETGPEHQLNQTGDEHPVEPSMDPTANQKANGEIDSDDHSRDIYQKQRHQSSYEGDVRGANQSNYVGSTLEAAIIGDKDDGIETEKPYQVSTDITGLDYHTSSDPAIKTEQGIKHNHHPVKRSDSMSRSEDSSVESMGWKVTSTLKQETLPSSELIEDKSESASSEIKGVLRSDARYSSKKGSLFSVNAPSGPSNSSRADCSRSSSANSDGVVQNAVDDVPPPPSHSTDDSNRRKYRVDTKKPDYSSSTAASTRFYDKVQWRHQEQNAPYPRVEDPSHYDAARNRQQRKHQPQHRHQYQHHQNSGRRSSGGGAYITSSSQSFATGRSDVAIAPSPNNYNQQPRHRRGRQEQRVRWQHSRNSLEGGALDSETDDDYQQFQGIQRSHSNVSSRSAATSVYSNAALDGYVDPDEDKRAYSGDNSLRRGTGFMSVARACRRNVKNWVGNAVSRGKKSSKDKTIGNVDYDNSLSLQRQRIPPPEIRQQTSRYRKDQSSSRPQTQYHFEGYDHLKSSAAATSPPRSSRSRNEYNLPTTEHQFVENGYDEEIRNPWANAAGGIISGEHYNDAPHNNVYKNDNGTNTIHESDLFMPNDELPPPAGEVNMAGFGMPAFKWWTWRQKDNMQDPHQGPRPLQGPGQEQDGDCTYFAFMCMFPNAAEMTTAGYQSS